MDAHTEGQETGKGSEEKVDAKKKLHENRTGRRRQEWSWWRAQLYLQTFLLFIFFYVTHRRPVRRHFVPRYILQGHIMSPDNMSPGQYVALCPHYFAVQRGDILSQETYCPGSVRRHIVPGDVLSRLATNGNFWQQMVTFGNKW